MNEAEFIIAVGEHARDHGLSDTKPGLFSDSRHITAHRAGPWQSGVQTLIRWAHTLKAGNAHVRPTIYGVEMHVGGLISGAQVGVYVLANEAEATEMRHMSAFHGPMELNQLERFIRTPGGLA